MSVQDGDIGGSGYTLDDLSAYLDRGRTPAIAAIDGNAECQAVLDSLVRLGALSRSLVDEEAAALAADAGWFDRVMSTISLEVRAGRDIPYPAPDDETQLVVTEGALRELVRRAGDSVSGVLVGRSTVTLGPEASARVALRVAVVADRPLHGIADEVRAAVRTALARHSPLAITAVDVTIADVDDAGDGGAA